MPELDLITPSPDALRQAAELGCKMANSEDFFQPDLRQATRYEDYRRFRNAHREQWERTDRFISVWLDRLFTLAEKEGKRLGLRMDDSMASWDTWYNRIVVPLKNTLWEAWERSCELPARYAETAHPIVAQNDPPSPVLQLAQVYATQLAAKWEQSAVTSTAA